MSKKQQKKKPYNRSQKTKQAGEQPKSRLKEAVDSITGLSNYLEEGLHEVKKADKEHFKSGKSGRFNGSLDIDAAKKEAEYDANRWDYAIEYNGEVFFVEVHPCSTSDVDTMLKKLEWLQQWLKNEAKAIDQIKTTQTTPYYWVSTGANTILKTSLNYKKLIQKKVVITRTLDCDKLFKKSV